METDRDLGLGLELLGCIGMSAYQPLVGLVPERGYLMSYIVVSGVPTKRPKHGTVHLAVPA